MKRMPLLLNLKKSKLKHNSLPNKSIQLNKLKIREMLNIKRKILKKLFNLIRRLLI